MDIKNLSIKELVMELICRKDIEIGETGPYQTLEVKRKYSNDRQPIPDATVIIVPHRVLL